MSERIDAMKSVLQFARAQWKEHLMLGQEGHDPTPFKLVELMIAEAEAADSDPKAKAKLATEALDGLHIETMMAISTAHVSESTMKHLEADDLAEVNVKPFSEEGVVVYLTSDEENWAEIRESYVAQTMPEDLWLAMCFAREQGCTWLLLDADAEEADGLKTFEW